MRTREIEFTSYAEIALARQPDDVAHPAFAKLFVETEFVPSLRRDPCDAPAAFGRAIRKSGRRIWSSSKAKPRAMCNLKPIVRAFWDAGRRFARRLRYRDGWPLSNTAGAVLDPVFSLRRRVRIPRGATARLAFWTMAAPTREEVLDLADKHHDAHGIRARDHARLDPGADAASSSRDRRRRGPSFPTARQPRALFRPGSAAARRMS